MAKAKQKKSAPTESSLIERWTNVERVLTAMPEHERQHHWDMSTWGRKTECGTIACAAGTCGLDPWFRRRGFKLNFDSGGDADISNVEGFFGLAGSKRIFFNSKPRPVEKVLLEVHDFVAELRQIETLTAEFKLPAIGTDLPEQGGVCAGVMLGTGDAPHYLLIVGPEHSDYLNWRAVNDWAGKLSVGELHDFTLFDRREGIALFDRVRSLFQPSWYWTSEQRADYSGHAWCQHFSNGTQDYYGKDYYCSARAVRRVPIQ